MRTAAFAAGLVFAAAGLLAACAAPNPHYDPARPHHRPHGYANSDGSVGGKSFWTIARWQLERLRDGLPLPIARDADGNAFPVVAPDLALLHANRAGPQVTATWIGHATVFLQIGGRNLLFDPHFSERASPVQFAGPKRQTRLPVALAELPRIDVVLITHSHYDHLDAATVDALARQPGGPPVFVVPLGLDVWLNARGIERVVRFDWWERKRIEGLDIELTPAKHWSGRSFWNRNTTLWGGWAVLANGFSFWHAGDTAYSADFVAIGRRFGGFDLAAIPVGSYEPRWLMHDVHATPDEAARIFVDVRAQRGIGVHWGTFVLSDEPLDRPIADLAHALDLHRIPHDRFVLFRHGETRVYSR